MRPAIAGLIANGKRLRAPYVPVMPPPKVVQPEPSELPVLTAGGTVVCLASGPSLTRPDVEYVRGKAIVLAVNDAIRLAPWADVFYTGDLMWWHRQENRAVLEAFGGLRIHLQFHVRIANPPHAPALVVRNTGEDGIEWARDGIRTVKNSGGAAINVAVHLGASRIVLLGYDMGPARDGRHHFHDAGKTRHGSPYHDFRVHTATMARPLAERGIRVVNCTPASQLDCFPRARLEDVLP